MKPKTPIESNTNSRREFIQQIALYYLAAQIPWSIVSCSTKQKTYKGSGKVPYKIWEEMLLSLETCPDHLESRMKNLVISKDAKAMFDFVRDEIHLIPANDRSLGYIGTQLKWGIKGALRYGMATPREKAALLHQMYTQAGIPSKIVTERTTITPKKAMAFFLRPIERAYTIEVSKAQWKQWKDDLQITTDTQNSLFESNHIKAEELAEQLWEYIPDKEKLKKLDFDFRWDNSATPTVEFELEGQTKYAHLFDTAVPFGELRDSGQISSAPPEKQNEETVEIQLSYREAIHPDKELPLVSGVWKSQDLIGNQVLFSSLNGLTIEQSALVPINNLRVFTPVLAFQSLEATAETLEANSFIGDAFTLEGKKVIIPDASNQNAPIVLNTSSSDLLKTIDNIYLKAIPVFKSQVKLYVDVKDSLGNNIEGLQAGDFNFTDNNNMVQVLMESNHKTPKILMLYDVSLSMPKEYYKEQMDAFINTLQQKILTTFPAAIIDKWPTPSELFTWLLKASKTDYDLIIYATDGDNDDRYEEENYTTYQNGPPALILNVNNSEASHVKQTFDTMAQITNGEVVSAMEQNKVIEKVVAYVNSMDISTYTFSYYTTTDKEHELILNMDTKRLQATDTFTLDTTENMQELNQGIIGLYLDLKIGNKKIKRVLAGWDPVTQKNIKPINANFLDVKSLLFGGCTFYFEGEGPTLAATIADLLKFKLSTRAWGEALLDDDVATAKTEFEKGGMQYHPNAILLMAPIENGITNSTYTFASGIRIGIYKQQLNISEKELIESFDYLPTSSYISFTDGKQSAFKTTLEKTAQLALREAALFSNNTYELLKKSSLIERETAISSNWFKNISRDDPFQEYWYERIYRGDGTFKIFDPTATQKAFWQVDKNGELYGILSDGAGGGKSIEQQLKELNKVMDLYMAIFTAMGVANTPLSIVATYGKTLVKLYAIVTEVLIVMDNTGMEDKVAEALKELACNVNKEIMFFALGKVGEVMGGLDLMISLMGGKGLPGTSCG